MQKKCMGQSMKTVRQVVLSTLANGMHEFPNQISKPLVKAMTLLALQPVASGARVDELNYSILVKNFGYIELFLEIPSQYFMLGYALLFFLVGIVAGYFVKNAIYKIQLKQVVEWASEQIGFHKREIEFVDDWDPEGHELRQFRVLCSVDDAESGEEYVREVDGGMARFVKLDRRRRLRHGFADGEEAEEESMEVDEGALAPVAAVSAAMAHGQDGDGPGTTPMMRPTPGTSPMPGGGAGNIAAGGPVKVGPRDAGSESATREYLESLLGSPRATHVAFARRGLERHGRDSEAPAGD